MVGMSLAVAACGSGANQAAGEAKGDFPVRIATASFPARQRLAQTIHLVIVVRNSGTKTIPNVAVSICNVTCSSTAPAGEGTGAAAFSVNLDQQYLANSSRPVWIVDRGPGPCGYSCQNGGPGAAVTAYSNTWALGALQPGHSARFDWAVTAVAPGRHVVAWQVAAGLYGNARAVRAGGGAPEGTFSVSINRAPRQSYVNNHGQIVTQ
jgi:hypothetical protein